MELRRKITRAFFLAFFFIAGWDRARAETELQPIVVTGRVDDLVGVASSATEGTIGAQELANRPTARPAEILESVPGMIITQHAGGGKANQYYLRGFTLDHGTDFAFYVDGVPVNLPSHAHGQGYSDLNWLIPELVQGVQYQKGVYDAAQGDFANAGSAEITYASRMKDKTARIEAGGLGYQRALLIDSRALGAGSLLTALEASHFDGAWDVPMNYRRLNGVVKFSEGDEKNGWSVGAQAYDGVWLGSEQVPERAVAGGLIGPFGNLDDSTGGNSRRDSVYGEWRQQGNDSRTHLTAYLVHYDLDLFSDFTYFLDQVHGDEIEQADSRLYGGLRFDRSVYGKLFEHDTEHAVGVSWRRDWIQNSLNRVRKRQVWAAVRADQISQTGFAAWYQNKTQWAERFRTIAGLRADDFDFDVTSGNPQNSGQPTSAVMSPKLSLVFGPWAKTEYYIQGGYGFRTNDARGVTTTVAPDTGGFSRPLPLIVKTRGAEVGLRSSTVENLNTTISLWSLWSDSDTFFSGDQGATVDADRPGRRIGIEWTNFWMPMKWLAIDADFAYSQARYTDGDPAGIGDQIPQSVTSVVAIGVSAREIPGFEKFFSSLRCRYFGPRPLTEKGDQMSAASSVVNLAAGYRFTRGWRVELEVLNLFDSRYNDNEYYYSSRLQGEPPGPADQQGYNDHMIHAGEPRSARFSLTANF